MENLADISGPQVIKKSDFKKKIHKYSFTFFSGFNNNFFSQ